MIEYHKNTPEETAAYLIKDGFSVEKYQNIQLLRKGRLLVFEGCGAPEVIIKAEQELIDFGEEVLMLLILNELKITKP